MGSKERELGEMLKKGLTQKLGPDGKPLNYFQIGLDALQFSQQFALSRIPGQQKTIEMLRGRRF